MTPVHELTENQSRINNPNLKVRDVNMSDFNQAFTQIVPFRKPTGAEARDIIFTNGLVHQDPHSGKSRAKLEQI